MSSELSLAVIKTKSDKQYIS